MSFYSLIVAWIVQFQGVLSNAFYFQVTELLYRWWLLHLLSIQIENLMKRFCIYIDYWNLKYPDTAYVNSIFCVSTALDVTSFEVAIWNSMLQ